MFTPLMAMNIVTIAYFLAIVCTIIVELHPRGRLGRLAAYASIAFVSTGGLAWSYAAFYSHYEWPEIHGPQRPQDDGAAARNRRFAMRGGEIDPEAGGDDIGASGQAGSASGGDGGGGANGGGVASDVIVSRALGLGGRRDALTNNSITDCEGCPPMVEVPAGIGRIGAEVDDTNATDAERPLRQVRFWPGFLISAEPISDQSFRDFMMETGRRIRSCGPKTAALASPGGTLPLTILDNTAATCVMPGDADAYAAWLSARTGKAFRLPTATEWEYAARRLPRATLATGHVAELVADCWHTHIPQQGLERIASRMGVAECDGRIVKSGAAHEEAHVHRPSARRQIGARETRAGLGFRVMRPLDRRR